MDQVRVLEEEHLTVVGTLNEYLREGAVVVVPRELEWTSSVILDIWLWWIDVVREASLLVVTA